MSVAQKPDPLAVPIRVDLDDGVVRMRAPAAGDRDAIVIAANDPDVARYTMVPSPYTLSDAEEFIAGRSDAWAEGNFTFAIVDAVTDEFLGMCGVHNSQPGGLAGGAAEVGYWLAPGARGRGVMTRALTLLCRWCFESMPLERLTWYTLEGNTASRAVAERVGFQIEGYVRLGIIHRGTRVDCWMGGLLRADMAS